MVSHSHKFTFFHHPKCAGTRFRAALAPYHDDAVPFRGIFHAPYFRKTIDRTCLRPCEMAARLPDICEKATDYGTTIVVRGPYARFLSAVNEHARKFRPQIDIRNMPPDRRTLLVEGFVRDWYPDDFVFSRTRADLAALAEPPVRRSPRGAGIIPTALENDRWRALSPSSRAKARHSRLDC